MHNTTRPCTVNSTAHMEYGYFLPLGIPQLVMWSEPNTVSGLSSISILSEPIPVIAPDFPAHPVILLTLRLKWAHVLVRGGTGRALNPSKLHRMPTPLNL